ncbi:MAG: hypothetical protein AB7W16_11410 [Candidatus Obscuribacterales bacterium]
MTSEAVDGKKNAGLLDFSPIADEHQASMLAGFVGKPAKADGPIIIDEDELLRDFSQWLEMVTSLRNDDDDAMKVYDTDSVAAPHAAESAQTTQSAE